MSHRQRIVDLVRRRGGQARDISQGVPFRCRSLGLLAVRVMSRAIDDAPMIFPGVPDRRHRDGHVDASPVLPHADGLVVVDPFTPSDPA
mgnify:CR=1 FL=1